MKPNACINLVVLAGLALLFAACELTIAPITAVEQSSSPLPQVESPLAVGADRLDSVASYHAMGKREERYSQADGSLLGGTVELHYYWTRSDGPFGYDEHQVTTLRDWEMETPGVMGESYLVDDLAFTYCASCPSVDDSAGGWSVTERNESFPAGAKAAPTRDALSGIVGMQLAELLAQSVVIGEESINGLTATHYQLMDAQVLSNMIRMEIGAPPDSPLEVEMAQLDIWLTVDDQQLIRYTFQLEGRMALVAGAQDLRPFSLSVQYSVTESDSSMTITVPDEVLAAVEPQLEALGK